MSFCLTQSHGAALALGLDLAQKSTTLNLRLAASLDHVGRASAPSFERQLRNLSARIGLTQLLYLLPPYEARGATFRYAPSGVGTAAVIKRLCPNA